MSVKRVSVAPDMLNWAIERSGKTLDAASTKFPKLNQWLTGELSPTVNQLKEFARWTHTPAPFLLLESPPHIELPIADFRKGRESSVLQPSTELIDTIHLCQRRQAWFEEYVEDLGLPGFRGTRFSPSISETTAAAHLRSELSYDMEHRAAVGSGDAARRYLISAFEDLGGLVVVNGVVGNNSSRRLDTNEFRGFTLSSDAAPLVFVNGADTKNGQVFSLAHEFCHVWRGDTGVSAETLNGSSNNQVEQWCNKVAAEFLVPAADLREQPINAETIDADLPHLSRRYACSTLVIILRLRDMEILDKAFLSRLYIREAARLRKIKPPPSSGGNMLRIQNYRIGKRFGHHLFRDTASGRTSFTDAMRLSNLNRNTLERFITGDQAA